MNNKYPIVLILFISAFALINFTSASTVQELQPASDIEYSETVRVPSIYVGSQGVGGVTFFNGTIINNTTNPDTGAPQSVTFGDNVRIDGYLHGGPSLGYQDDNVALKIGDNVYPGLDNANDFGKPSHRWRDAHFAGSVSVGDLVGTGVVNSDNLATTNSASADQVLSYNGSNLEWATVGSSSSNSGITVGTITAVTAGTGLTGGGTSGAVTLNVDDTRYVNTSGDTMTGYFAQEVVSVPSNTSGVTATVDVSGGNIFLLPSNTLTTRITNLDNPTVGQIIHLVGNTNSNEYYVNDAAPFYLNGNWSSMYTNDTLTLLVVASNRFVELARSNN